MGIRVVLHGFVKGLKYQGVIIPFAQYVSRDTPVIQIQDGAEIDFVYFNALIPLELRYIRQPLLIRLGSMKVSVKQILSQALRILSVPGAAIIGILNCGLDIHASTDSQSSLVVDTDSVVMAQIVVDPAVTFVRTFGVDLLHECCYFLVFLLPGAFLAGCPLVIGRTGNLKQVT